MGLMRRLVNAMRIVAPDGERAFLTGAGVVDESDFFWGHESETYAPAAYGDYVATSSIVYAATKMRATLLASVPLKLSTGTGDRRKEVTSGPARDLLDAVNPFWTWQRLMQMTELSLCLWGKSFWFVNRSGRSGAPKEIWWARPDRVKVVPDPTNYVSHFLYQPMNGREPIRFERDETIWIRTPNPLDEFEGLSPVASIRLSADTATAAVKSNRLIFSNGIQAGGFFAPKAGQTLTPDQAKELSDQMDRRFRGVDKAHRWGIFTFDVDAKTIAMSPKDAEFLGALNWTKEDIALAFGVPLDLIGGQRTYANVDASERIVWTFTIKPEADFIAAELTEQLLPMFGVPGLTATFDFEDVEVFRENENDAWAREKEQIASGALTINEWRKERGLTALPWGDDWWAPIGLVPIGGSMATQADQAAQEDANALAQQMAAGQDAAPGPTAKNGQGTDGGADAGADRGHPRPRRMARTIAYGSTEHERLYQRAVARTDPWEGKVGATVAGLMRSQRQSLLKLLRDEERSAGQRLAVKDLLETIFVLPRWIRAFRSAMRPVIVAMVEEFGQAAADDLGLSIAFDISDPNVIRAIERQAQRFAVQVNQTTWDALRATLADGLEAGEGTDDLAKRVEAVMGNRIRSSGEVIARTEVVTASSTGSIESARQSGVVRTKTWLAALDSRTRDSHVEAHGQTVGLDEEFSVGGARGQGPGLMGAADEDINCRCSLTFGLDTDQPPRALNGHDTTHLLELARIVGVKA